MEQDLNKIQNQNHIKLRIKLKPRQKKKLRPCHKSIEKITQEKKKVKIILIPNRVQQKQKYLQDISNRPAP